MQVPEQEADSAHHREALDSEVARVEALVSVVVLEVDSVMPEQELAKVGLFVTSNTYLYLSGERPRGCFNCGEDGHRSAECTQPRKERAAGGGCYNCGQEGHRSSECTEPAKPREGSFF